MMMRRKGARGVSLIEAAIVLGIVGVVVGGIWVAAGKLNRDSRRDEIQKEVVRLYENFRNLYGGSTPIANNCVAGLRGCLVSFLSDSLINISTLPANLKASLEDPDTETVHRTPSGVYIQVINEDPGSSGAPSDMITFIIGPLDYADCVWLAGSLDTSSGWVGGRFYRWIKYTYSGYEWPAHRNNGSGAGITPSSAETVCEDNELNFVLFPFLR